MTETIQLPSPPDLKIIKDGKAVDTSAIDDYDSFMNFLMLASIASQAVRIRRHFDDKTSLGRTQGWDLNVTPDVQELICIYPSQSLYVVNDGPGQIFVKENTPTRDATPLLAHEEMVTDFETHKLERFYVWSAPGTIATARAKVKY